MLCWQTRLPLNIEKHFVKEGAKRLGSNKEVPYVELKLGDVVKRNKFGFFTLKNFGNNPAVLLAIKKEVFIYHHRAAEQHISFPNHTHTERERESSYPARQIYGIFI